MFFEVVLVMNRLGCWEKKKYYRYHRENGWKEIVDK
jgi:hypothetical protein